MKMVLKMNCPIKSVQVKFVVLFLAICASILASRASNRPIGVFDSGTGGLTVLEKLLCIDEFNNITGERIPDSKPDLEGEDFVYFGDQANMPYGLYGAKGKSDFLRELIVRDTEFVLSSQSHLPSKIVVIACNTATAYGLDDARRTAKPKGVKVIGVVNAGVDATMDALKVKEGMAPFAVGVIATPGTIASGVYERTLRAELKKRKVDCCEIVNRGGIGLAEAVENDEKGVNECARTNFTAMVESYRASGGKAPIRAVILGCTHYPFVLSQFKKAVEELKKDSKYSSLITDDVVFIDPAVYTAIQCYSLLKNDNRLNGAKNKKRKVEAFISVGRNGPLTMEEKYGRPLGLKDIGTVIVPMTEETMSKDAVKRLYELLPFSSKEIFSKALGS
jgi:glutamate racemase